MNPTDAEIAGKLDGVKLEGQTVIHKTDNRDHFGELFVSISSYMRPSQLLAFCRAVVERCDKVENNP